MAKVSDRVYEDFAPVSDLVSEKECDTFLLYLPGFKKEQLRVQLTPSRILRISGERPIGDGLWKRFQKEIPVPPNVDSKEIKAKFEGGILFIRQPKLITPAPTTAEEEKQQEKEKPASVGPTPQPQQLPPPPPPQPQPQQEVAPPHQQPPPLPPQLFRETSSKVTEKVAPPNNEEKSEKFEDATAKNDEERKDKCELEKEQKQGKIVGRSGIFKELRNPEILKRLGVFVLSMLIVIFYIVSMFKSLTKNKQQGGSEYNREL